jgi:uncharacterized protein
MYHEGEIEAQQHAGERTIGERNGKMLTNKIIPGAINFIEKQPLFIISSQNNHGELFASLLAGEPGFIKVIDPGSIAINTKLINSSRLDPFWSNISAQTKTGMLFIELSSRRRFRINGKIALHDEILHVSIDQAYPNCPKYIQQRQHVLKTGKPVYEVPAEHGTLLAPHLRDLIRQADTFFVASSNDAGDMDASHRGGLPGFVSIADDGALLIPDYSGNGMYNTLGNFIKNPRAGLVFPDFEHQRTLQLTGTVEICWKSNDQQPSGGTGRFWKFYPGHWILLENLKGFDWNFVEYSSFNPEIE